MLINISKKVNRSVKTIILKPYIPYGRKEKRGAVYEARDASVA